MAALQPKLQALEAQWTQLHAASGAKTAEELVKYWRGEPIMLLSSAGVCMAEQLSRQMIGSMLRHSQRSLRDRDSPQCIILRCGC